ncbi:hypothetical protein BX261_7254 [Streptomyces sp. 2321.6]|uniref:hypothetical protein n=1 Tax=Streptomyces sp. 2321.6 TaxID=1938840 RepID=UPI000BB10E9B|nr:hypothetical protein [Streptomyces sp. 2321.6]PBC72381.1 hypothetical protein BX261_7254 [Streptomyces sp. 2321.6]
MTDRCVADLMISALRDAGYAARHKFTDVGYSAVVIDLGDGSAIHVGDADCSAHHTVAEHVSPWWAVHLPNPAEPEVLETIYLGTYGAPIADDTAACVRAVVAFIAARTQRRVAAQAEARRAEVASLRRRIEDAHRRAVDGATRALDAFTGDLLPEAEWRRIDAHARWAEEGIRRYRQTPRSLDCCTVRIQFLRALAAGMQCAADEITRTVAHFLLSMPAR